MVPPTLTRILEEEQQALLDTRWLVPIISYTKGGSFGERSLTLEKDYRAGSAICIKACQLTTLSKEDY